MWNGLFALSLTTGPGSSGASAKAFADAAAESGGYRPGDGNVRNMIIYLGGKSCRNISPILTTYSHDGSHSLPGLPAFSPICSIRRKFGLGEREITEPYPAAER